MLCVAAIQVWRYERSGGKPPFLTCKLAELLEFQLKSKNARPSINQVSQPELDQVSILTGQEGRFTPALSASCVLRNPLLPGLCVIAFTDLRVWPKRLPHDSRQPSRYLHSDLATLARASRRARRLSSRAHQ